MTGAQFQIWSAQSIERYAREKMHAMRCSRAEAERIARHAFEARLPDGLSSADNFLRAIVHETDTVVGSLWYCVRHAGGRRSAFICDLIVDEGWRRNGIGYRTMLLLEEAVRELDVESIGLHVFGSNAPARALYARLGYVVVDAFMEKVLSRDPS
jgi:ribosomal protein S18 acetylase RimI-like enzyme